jgi:hypothetical protein
MRFGERLCYPQMSQMYADKTVFLSACICDICG